jgi:hypothetical protein
MVATLGTLAGLAGVEHGIGEILQGNVAPEGLAIIAWPGSELFQVLNGEPAMTIVPSLLVTGILAILVSLIYILWATMLAERKHSGLAMILLSIVMLLVGAGFGSALLGLIVGLTATRINAPLTWWRARPANARRIPGQSFLWLYAACVASWLLLLPGSVILAQIFGTDITSNVVPVFILCAFGFMLLAYLAGFARDSLRPADASDGAVKIRAGHNRNGCIGETGNTAIIEECRV